MWILKVMARSASAKAKRIFPFSFQSTMLRRQARERRAYLHQKALAAKSNIAHLRKLKAHIDKDKELPKELQDPSLRKDLRYDEAQLMIDEADQMDDEYYNLGMREPRILITTSRDPSSRLLQFSKVQFSLYDLS